MRGSKLQERISRCFVYVSTTTPINNNLHTIANDSENKYLEKEEKESKSLEVSMREMIKKMCKEASNYEAGLSLNGERIEPM